jgi:hypothetical protein
MPVNEWLPPAKNFRSLFPIVPVKSVETGEACVCQVVWTICAGVRFQVYRIMKSRENLVRLKQFQVNEKRRQLLQLDMMIAEFERMAVELELQITAEEKKAGITDINHFAYPTFAKAARLRRDNLRNSQGDLAQQRSVAESLLGEAEAELSKAEMLESRDTKIRDAETGGRSAMIG